MSARCHLPLLLASVLFVSISTWGQQVPANPGMPPVELKLTAVSDKACLDSFVPLELKITNITKSDLEIRELDVFRNYAIEFMTDAGSRELVANLLIWPGTKREEERLREIHVLKTDESYTATFKLSVWDRRVFSRPGKYWLRTYYKESASSNAVSFEVVDCKSN